MTAPIHKNQDNPFAAPASEVLEGDPESNSESSRQVRASLFKRIVAGILDLFIGGFLVVVAFILTAGFLVTLNDSTNNLQVQYRPLLLIPPNRVSRLQVLLSPSRHRRCQCSTRRFQQPWRPRSPRFTSSRTRRASPR